MERIDEAKSAGQMDSGGHASQLSHARHPRRAYQPAVIVQVRLNDIRHAVANHPLETPLAGLLLAKGNGDGEGVGHLLGGVEIVERARFLVMDGLDVFEHLADADGFGRVVRAIGVGMDDHLVPQRFAGERD